MATEQVNATFEVTSWDETPFDEEGDVAKLTRASVEKRYEGAIDGTSATEWLMAYAPDGSARFVGIERIRGSVAGRDGTLVIAHDGTFADGKATATITVVSGTAALEGATGTGDFVADPAGSVKLDVELA